MVCKVWLHVVLSNELCDSCITIFVYMIMNVYYVSNAIMSLYAWSHLLELRRQLNYLSIFPPSSCKDHKLTLCDTCVILIRCRIWTLYHIELAPCELDENFGIFHVSSVRNLTLREALSLGYATASNSYYEGGHSSSLVFYGRVLPCYGCSGYYGYS